MTVARIAGRVFRAVFLVVATLVVLVAALWAAGTLWYQAVPSPALAIAPASIFLMLGLGAMIGLWRRRYRALAVFGVLLAPVYVFWIGITPSNDRDWDIEVARNVTYERQGDIVTINNVRNFDWASHPDSPQNWETRTYDLRTLTGIDLLSLYWMGPAIAHTYVEFTFADGRALSFSIEIRKEKSEPHSFLAGFFKRYELIILVGDERDFIGWRVDDASQHVEMFRSNATPDEARGLMVGLLDRANQLAATPEFYNTITDNCTTVVYDVTDRLGARLPLDWRIILSGYLADYFYGLGRLDTSLSMDELRRRGEIMPKVHPALKAGLRDADFSAALRDGVPMAK